MFSSPDKQDKIIAILEDIRKWTKLQGAKTLKQLFEEYVNDEKKQMIYQLSDGKSSPEVAEVAKVTSQTVRNYWKLWASVGLMEIYPAYKNRYHRIFSVEDVGIESPETQESPPAKQEQKGEAKERPGGLEVFTKDTSAEGSQNGR